MHVSRSAAIAYAILGVVAASVVSTPAALAGTIKITEFSVPTSHPGLNRITAGPDGDVWFTEGGSDKIGKVTVGGHFTEYQIPTPDMSPIDIVEGPDGNVWFTEFGNDTVAGNIGRVTPAGDITEFPVTGGRLHQFGMTVGPDGNIWFLSSCCQRPGNEVGRMTLDGRVTLFPVAPNTSSEVGITTGPDGNLWFTAEVLGDRSQSLIERMTPSGQITGVFHVPTAYADPSRLVTGPDGNVWFTEQGAVGANGCCYPTHPAHGAVGQITPSGHITEFETPTPFSNPAGITVGHDGNMWFTEYSYLTHDGRQWGGNKIGRVTTSGVITEFALTTQYARADGITSRPDGIYFVESPHNYASGLIARLRVDGEQGAR